MHLIRTEALIPAAPERVWTVLADFDRYAEWNPLNIKAVGQARLGDKVPMTFLNLSKPGTTLDQTVTIVACEPGRSLAWGGQVPLLFKGRHHFTLMAEGPGTRVLHGEDLGGLIPMTFSKAQIERDFVPAYEAVNAALAVRVAAIAA
jgi:hypothetical protein